MNVFTILNSDVVYMLIFVLFYCFLIYFIYIKF